MVYIIIIGAKLKSVFDDINRNVYDPSFIVITDDLVHEGNQMDYKLLNRWITTESHRMGIPIHVILGNHDRTDAFYEGYLDQDAKPKYYYKVELADYDCYFLDTTFGNIEQGYIDKEQLKWLSDNLHSSKKKTLLFMHHPAYGPVLSEMKYSILQNSDEFYHIIQGQNVIATFAGHVHFPATYVQNGILNAIGDSTAYHIDCRDPHIHSYADSTSYNIIDIDDDNVSSNIVYLLNDGIVNNGVNGHIKVANTGYVDKAIFHQKIVD